MKMTMAAKIDAILKFSIVVSVVLASCSVGYYYLVHLPQRDVQFEPQRVLERFRAAAEKRAEQELSLFERKVSEKRAAEQKAVEEQQALEKANRYEACLSRATDTYNISRLAACNRPREKIIKDQDDCVKLGFSRNVCAMAHVVPEASPNCTLPRTVKLALDANLGKAHDLCLEEDKNGFAGTSTLGSTQIRTSGLGPAIVEPAEPAPIAPPLKARVPSPKSAAVPAAPVVPQAPEAAAPETKRFFAAQRAPIHAGWIIQIGAFDIEREAQRQLSSAHAKAGHVLDNADPFTEVVVKGDKTLYRARFAGFQQKDEAEAVCKQLKLRDIDCITIKN
jgi:cell division septation protein DedD